MKEVLLFLVALFVLIGVLNILGNMALMGIALSGRYKLWKIFMPVVALLLVALSKFHLYRLPEITLLLFPLLLNGENACKFMEEEEAKGFRKIYKTGIILYIAVAVIGWMFLYARIADNSIMMEP